MRVLVCSPKLNGEPVFQGTDIPVYIVGMMASFDLLSPDDYPELGEDDVECAVLYVEHLRGLGYEVMH